MRQAERRAVRNKSARSAVRTYAKRAAEAVLTTAEDAAQIVRTAVSELDKAAHKGIVHPNAAARRKSRLMARLHQLSLAGEAPSAAPEAETKGKAAPKTAGKRTTGTAKGATADKKPATARKPTTARKPAAKK